MAKKVNGMEVTKEEMLESIARSGYLLESEIANTLNDAGYFVQSSVPSLDPLTGKSREIDLFVEYDRPYDETRMEHRAIAFTRFVFEIKNNDFPLVLMTEHQYSPHSAIWEAICLHETIPDDLKGVFHRGYWENLYQDSLERMFTQYCSFAKKKQGDELMALHPEVVYSGLQKITHFCKQQIEILQSHVENSYFRNFHYQPVFLINDGLFELELTQSGSTLKEVTHSRLLFNFHYNEEPTASIVWVVTKRGLKDFLEMMRDVDEKVESNMMQAVQEHKQKQLEQKRIATKTKKS